MLHPVRTLSTMAIGTCVFGAMLHAQARPAAGRGNAALPTVTVGGIQIVKIVTTSNETFGKPFNADNGVKVALWIKMAPGQGLIEIDEDASVLEAFTDDKGTDLGGKFESFPDEFKDGSGGTLEIETSGMPATGASRLNAEGNIAMTIATGTRPTRVSNVQITDGRTVKIGATTATLAEVSAEDGNVTFTLKLPRQVMTTIKDVKFLDGRNRLEGHISGTGYMNDAGELNLTVKTALKTLTLEFDMWQGMRTIKVPFKVQAGVGLGS